MKVVKRNGKIDDFQVFKVKKAIEKAFNATKTCFSEDMLDILSLRVTADFQEKIIHGKVDIEEIQNSVEKVLSDVGYSKVAKAYILYRKQREKLRDMKNILDYSKVVDSYINTEDWRVKENSTVTYSIGGLILHNSGAISANYWLSEIYDEEIANSHRNGDFHLHDLSMLTGYCAGWSLRELLEEGLGGVNGKITSSPAKHLSTLCNQMVNFLGIMQNEFAGAQAFSSFDTYLAPFIKKDNMEYKEVKQCIQSFIYGVNTPSRWGTQAPFSNITLDWTVPKDLSEEYAIIGGKKVDFKYKDCQKEMDIINKAFIEIMLEGDANGRGFQYPIPTYNVTEDFVWNSENAKLLFDMTSKYGTPYFQNFIKSDLNPGDVRSMCCRLQLDKRELKKKTGGLFGSGEKTGSIGVVTINLPRISFTSENEEEFFERLSYIMNIAKRSLEIKRKVITKFMDDGLYPYAKRYLNNFNTHFSTIGLIGLNECSLNASWIKSSLISERGRLFGEKVLEFMREKIADFQEETGNLYNLEATPAESTSYRLAKMDKEKYQEIVLASKNGESPFYTNSCHLPVNYTDDIFDALEIQEKLQSKFTGGTVFHGFLGEKIKDWETCSKLVKTIASNFRVPYFTISPTYSICKTHGYLEGEQFVCPHCSEETEVYSRITGYYRPIKHWNDGKQSEYLMRKEYTKYSEDSEENKNSEIIYKYLFTTETCPKCPEAKNLLKDEENITFINASDNIEHALKYNIRSVPSLVIVNEENRHKVYSGLTEIYKFLSM
ncbi:MAG: ribonucleoside triphosphate reductase [Fusobacteriaceae bacterium]|nr:ribonucleoside triphosphate reductase [Fusobacteriaceae bacterium]MBN2837668.1 ribonucleoside triphosphate reductase [Fusobacteriaceae bacterium]